MAIRAVPNVFAGSTWSARLFASLVVQVLLTMLGFGIGLLAIDIPTASSARRLMLAGPLRVVGGVGYRCIHR